MFESFRKFLSDVSEGEKRPTHFEHDDYRLAAAALLVHAVAIDGSVSDVEREKLHAVIKRQFGYAKTRYRGLMKNTAQITTLFALSNLWMTRRALRKS